MPVVTISRRKKILFGLVTSLISMLFAMLMGELTVRVVAPQDLSGSWLELAPRGYSRNKAGGQSRHQFGQRVVHYRFNQHHLRGGPLQAAAAVRVLALGDSFTFGWLLNESDTFLAEVNHSAEVTFGKGKVEILNGGAGGWGTADYLAFLEDEGESLKPDIVLLFLGVDDTRRAAVSRLYRLINPAEAMIVEPVQHAAPALEVKHLVRSIPGYEFLLEHSHLFQLARKASSRGATGGKFAVPEATDSVILKQKALFRRLNEWCKKRNVKLLVATNWPSEQRFTPVPLEANQYNIEFRTESKEFFRKERIEFFEAGPRLSIAMADRLDDFRIYNDGHPSEAGARLIARVIWPWLAPKCSDLLASGKLPDVSGHTETWALN